MVVGTYAVAIVGAALFPRLAYWARWRTRLGVRGRIVSAACHALVLFVGFQFVVPRLKRWSEQHEQLKAELREKLGREPTERDWFEHYGLEPP